jgi:CheY-like chemotaxis protein/HPt (histidine-containing phosphotransfer) domain-containing protein
MVMLTSTNDRGERSAARAAGIDAYLTKPVRQSQLYERLREVLGPEVVESAAPSAATPVAAVALGSVLVAEDNPVNQRVVQAMLTRLGYAVDIADDGRRAVDLVLTRHYDVVLMDCQMPELDGFAATREIRAAGGAAGAVPVVALTASALAGDEERCREAGMDDFLSKPVRRDALAATLQRWAAGQSRRVQLPAQPTGRQPEPADGIDRALLGEMLNLGEAFGQVIRSYLDTTPGRLDDLDAAARDGDRVAVARLAHLLAGSSGCVGATVLSGTCTGLEQDMQLGSELDPSVVLRLRLQHARAAEALGELLVTQAGERGAGAGR